jgi:hypothetical protein
VLAPCGAGAGMLFLGGILTCRRVGWRGLARLTTALGRVLYSLRYTNRVFGAARLQLLAASDELNTHLHVEFTPQFEKCARIARKPGLGRG